MKKVIMLVAMLGLLVSSLMPGYAESNGIVQKVVFRGMTTNESYLGIGGIRFYSGGTMLESGNVISNAGNVGETDKFRIEVSSNYGADDPYYRITNSVDTAQIQTGSYTQCSYWIAATGQNEDQSYAVTFKTPQAVDKIEFVPLPDSIANRGIEEPFVIEVYTTDGIMTPYDITPITERNTVQTLTLPTTTASALTLDVNADHYELSAGETIDVNVELSNATDIYAEDFTVKYDTAAFELVSSQVANTDAYKIFHEDESTAGQVRFIVASNGENYGITGKDNILTLKFKAKSFEGETDILVKSGLVADAQGNELEPTCLGKTFNLLGGYKDVNGTDTFTLGDLAIASHLLAKDSSTWGTFTPDVDTSGAVDNTDLTVIVAEILN